MRKLTSFRPKATIAALLLGVILLAPWASHGCQARGTNLHSDNPVAGVIALGDTQITSALHLEFTPSKN
ncbi:MAG: hypothetical protein BZY88_17725 [SAR202 cluster bacterium Io17-Chloro-G9]|nr:MAG: hypothetical protein BZY88_17725 [SAR202 cluster bacterium Io17-Chloro-G9]